MEQIEENEDADDGHCNGGMFLLNVDGYATEENDVLRRKVRNSSAQIIKCKNVDSHPTLMCPLVADRIMYIQAKPSRPIPIIALGLMRRVKVNMTAVKAM